MAGDDAATDGGMTAQHAAVPRGPYRVAPTDGTDKFNAIRIPLVPVACWRLGDPAFAFDSSFVGPAFAPELAKLAALVAANAGCPASIFAHADPVGSDDVNKTIGDRRAIAIYAALTRQPDKWEELYSNAVDGDTWGTPALQAMLATLKDASGISYYSGAIDGEYGPNTKDATKRFQGDAGLAADGQAGPATRKVLFGAYVDAVCSDPSGGRFTMKPEDFLGGGADSGGKMAMQGCSRFNPVVLLPTSEESAGSGARDADNASNRRVLLFLFRPRTTSMAEWPCPRVNESGDACKSQFWPDGDQRRQNGPNLRLYRETRDTMACRFYDRFARRSPCEGMGPVQISVALRDWGGELIKDAPYRIKAGSRSASGRAADGVATLTVGSVPETCTVEWGLASDGDIESGTPRFTRDIYLRYDTGADEQQAKLRLHNLGYPDDAPYEVNVFSFQQAAGIEATGTLDDATKQQLARVHGTLATDLESMTGGGDGTA